MQTITIDGRELPIDGLAGCKRLNFIYSDFACRGKTLQVLLFNYDDRKRHWTCVEDLPLDCDNFLFVVCVAARWFERLAKVTFKRHAMSGVSMLDAINRSPGAIQVDEYRAAARAWGELADELWGE